MVFTQSNIYILLCKNLTLFVDAAKQEGVKEKDAEVAVKKWLQGAPDREGGRKERERKKKGRIKISYEC